MLFNNNFDNSISGGTTTTTPGFWKKKVKSFTFFPLFYKKNKRLLNFSVNIKFLIRVRNKFSRFILRKNVRSHKRFLKRLGRNFFYYFIRKIGIYKHRFFLSTYFQKGRSFWLFRRRKFRNNTLQQHAVTLSKVPRLLSNYNLRDRQRTLSLLLKSIQNIKHFELVHTSNYQNLSPIASYLKRANVRLFSTQNMLSGYRFLKYMALFSKKGNYRCLLNLFFKYFLNNRFSLFQNVNSFFFRALKLKQPHLLPSIISRIKNDYQFFITKSKSNLRAKFSLLCRRLLFGQMFSFQFIKSSNKINIKVSKLFNNNFFLLSLRLLNRMLSVFKIYIETKPWKKSGRSIVVPVPIKSKARRSFIFAHWFKGSVLSKLDAKKSFGSRVFSEFQDLSRLDGESVKKLGNLSKTVQLNRALIRKSNIRLI